MVTINGIIKLNDTGLRVMLDNDLTKYYIWLITKHFFNLIKLDSPAHGAHISIVTTALHKDKFNIEYLKQYHNTNVEVEYNPEELLTGGRGFTNYWFRVEFPLGTAIKKNLGIIEDNFKGFHFVVANNKNQMNYQEYKKSLLTKNIKSDIMFEK